MHCAAHLLFGAMASAAATADDGDDWMGQNSSISPLQDAENAMAVVRVVPGVAPGEVAPSPPGPMVSQAWTPMAYMPGTLGSIQPAAPRALSGPSTFPELIPLPASGRTSAGGVGAITDGRVAMGDVAMSTAVARQPPRDVFESRVKRGRSFARPSSPAAALTDQPMSRVMVQQQTNDGSVELALALRGQQAHQQWAYQEAAPQRVAHLEETVLRLEESARQMRMSIEAYEDGSRREQEHFAHVAACAAQRMQEMAKDQIDWAQAEEYARSVMYERDEQMQQH